MKTLELKIPPVVVVLIVGLAMWLAAHYAPLLALALPWRTTVFGVLVVTCGIFGVSGIMAFRKVKTTVNPTKPDTASAMVISGIYNTTRNPMYFGLFLALLGWAYYLSNALSFLLLPLFVAYMNRFQILPEERALCAKFGSEFLVYAKSVRRWI